MRALLMSAMLMTCAAAQAEPAREGDRLYKENCARCHGVRADGDTPIARVVKPPPPDLRRTRLTEVQIREIVIHGGEGVGRSPIMPNWGFQLSTEQIDAVVAYVNGLRGGAGGVKSAARSQ
ncbi:MAG: c-type cytochrome [Burkholderiales bacterium]|jgi:mono/diheme cytochrome c family protein